MHFQTTTVNKRTYEPVYTISLSTIVLNVVGIDKECMECNIFEHLETHLTISFSQKTDLNALVKL